MARKRSITAEDLYTLETVSDPQVSPNGKHIVFGLQRVERKSEKKFSNLWLVPVSGGKATQFTVGDQRDGMPRWSPDGETIAFMSSRGEGPGAQIHLIPLHGGEARPLSKIKGRVTSMQWSPDGRKLLCTVIKHDPEVLAREADPQKKKLGVVARHYDRLFFKRDGAGYIPKERNHIWVVDARSGKATQLTDSERYDEHSVSWSPDGSSILFASNHAAEPDKVPWETDLYRIPAGGGDPQPLNTPVGTIGKASPSPSGRYIAYIGGQGAGDVWRNQCLYLMDADGSNRANLTQQYDISVNDFAWGADDELLYLTDSYHGSVRLSTIKRDGTEFTQLLAGPGWVGGFTLDAACQTAAIQYGQIDKPFEIYTLALKNNRLTQRTRFGNQWLRNVDLGEVEEHWFKSNEGDDLQGWILKPPGFDPEKQYPAIIEIHGGPLGQYGNMFMHEFYYFAARGYVIGFSNPRGGRGYGEAHAGAIVNGWGIRDYADIMSFTDLVESQPYVDKQRLGVTGGSYGGYLTNWIIGHTDRYKAAVTQRSICNLISLWGASDINWAIARLVGSDQSPLENFEAFWEQSPLKHISNAKTPTLIIHSEKDLRCPQDQAEQLYVALQKLEVETELVLFPEEPHGLSRMGRTDRRIARLNHILRWFDSYM